MMSSGTTATRSSSRFPFTANQWQELEHQALVYKYMISGMPIPPELLFTIKRSLDSPPNSKLLLHHPPHSMGWNCIQMGFGRKIDPEPGRCRRTDGKKWRCSKEAYPDSKYCERHMHRGRNRSRKPVEVNANNNNNLSMSSQTSSATIHPPTSTPISSITKSPNYPSSMASSDSHHQHLHNQVSYNGNSNSFLYSQSPSSRNLGFPNLTSQDPFLLDSASYSHSDKDYRLFNCRSNYGHGMMKDEHPFFSETPRSTRSVSDSWHLEPLRMGSSKPNGYSSYLQTRQQKQDDQNYFDHDIGLKMEREEDEPQKVMHHFFDEWPRKNNDSSTTQLSISMPISSHDFFVTHNDK